MPATAQFEQLPKREQLKIKLKKWEKSFWQVNGRKPKKEDVKLSGDDVQELYRKYWASLKCKDGGDGGGGASVAGERGAKENDAKKGTSHRKEESKSAVTSKRTEIEQGQQANRVWKERHGKKNVAAIAVARLASTENKRDSPACKPFLTKLMKHYASEEVVKQFRFKKKKKKKTESVPPTEPPFPPNAHSDSTTATVVLTEAFQADDLEDVPLVEEEATVSTPVIYSVAHPALSADAAGAEFVSELEPSITISQTLTEESMISEELETHVQDGVHFEAIGPSDIFDEAQPFEIDIDKTLQILDSYDLDAVYDETADATAGNNSPEDEQARTSCDEDEDGEPFEPFEGSVAASSAPKKRGKPRTADNFIKINMKKKSFASKGYKKFNMKKYKRQQYKNAKQRQK